MFNNANAFLVFNFRSELVPIFAVASWLFCTLLKSSTTGLFSCLFVENLNKSGLQRTPLWCSRTKLSKEALRISVYLIEIFCVPWPYYPVEKSQTI
jgi:hypothetical protein